MNIIFICGSLEPGRDGVGDYTRKLAAELIRQENHISIIALHDRQLAQLALESIQTESGTQINTLRLSDKLSWKDKVEFAVKFVKLYSPDWISLQYVPFSFQMKGLPFGLASVLKRISEKKNIHIMFHELWLGMSIQSSMKYLLWGWMQRRLTKSLLFTIKPKVIHTQTVLYQINLHKIGTNALLLPLFANVPYAINNRPVGDENIHPDTPPKINFVFFGGIHPGAPVEQLAKEVAIFSAERSVPVDLTIVGRSGSEREAWVNAWRSHGLSVTILGEQTPECISEILSNSSIGLSTTPLALSGKSGSIAAMHAHGLPVLCVTKPWQPRGNVVLTTFPGIFEYRIGNLGECIANKDNSLPISTTVSEVALQLISDLSDSSILNVS